MSLHRLYSQVLLDQLSKIGLHLLPREQDASKLGCEAKAIDLESQVCDEIALVAPTCLVSFSKLNSCAKEGAIMYRVLEATEFYRVPQEPERVERHMTKFGR